MIRFNIRNNPWILYLILSIPIVVLIKFLISFIINTPVIFVDEHAYGILASEISKGNLFFIGEIPSQISITHPYPAGYSYFLSPAYLISDNIQITYRLMQLTNAILSTILIIPVFLIMKRFVDRKTSFFTSILLSVLPTVMTYNYLLMSENAFFLVFLVSCYLLLKVNECQKFDYNFLIFSLLLFASIILLIFIKAIGIAMLFALMILIIYKIITQSFRYFLLFWPLLTTIIVIFTQSIGYNISTYVKNFSYVFTSEKLIIRFFTVILNEFTYLLLMGYVIFLGFALFLIFYFKYFKKEKKSDLLVFIIYSTLSIIFLIFITTAHICLTDSMLYARYISVGLLPVFMLGVIGAYHYKNIRNTQNSKILLYIFIVLGAILLFGFSTEGFFNLANNFDIVWALSLDNFQVLGVNGFLLAKYGLIIFSLIFFVWFCCYKKNRQILFFSGFFISLLLISSNLAWVAEESDIALDFNYHELPIWLNRNYPRSTVLIDADNTMNHDIFLSFYTSMYFWHPKGKIQILNNSFNGDFLVSMNDYSNQFEIIKNVSVGVPNSKVIWHMYSLSDYYQNKHK